MRAARWIGLAFWSVAVFFVCVAFIFVVARVAYGWEGDDGGLDQWEVSVGVYADRMDNQMQLTDPPKPPAPVRPTPIPGDCDSWARIFRWYGATDSEIQFFFGNAHPWGVSRTNIIWGESMCGTRFKNTSTGDTGICQLNGVHNPWTTSLFGLRTGKSVSESEASNPAYARPCLYLLRGSSNRADAFGGACNWKTPNFCS